MPIALLLQEALSPLATAELVLTRWQAMLQFEALVVSRARGAFVVQWFGPRLAAAGGRLLVGIQNIGPLTEQYRRARAKSVAGDTGPNLLEPLASLAGMGVGMFLSPSGAVLTLFALLRREFGRIVGVLLTITHSIPMIELMTGVGAGLIIGLGLPIFFIGGIVYALYAALSDDDIVRQHELLGDLTRMIESVTRFINLLTGPREAIRNPLLAAILGLVDALAALMAQIVGAAAIALTRWLPLVAPNIQQFRLLRDLAVAAIDLVKAMLIDAFGALERLYTTEEGQRASPWDALQLLFRHIERVVGLMADGAIMSLTEMGAMLGTALSAISTATETNLRDISNQAKDIISNLPLARTMRGLVAIVTAVRMPATTGGIPTAPAAPPPPTAAPPSTASQLAGAAAALVPALVAARVGPPPPEPSLTVAGFIVRLTRMGWTVTSPWGPGITAADAAPFVLSAETQGRVQELLRAPGSLFSAERAALRRELGGEPSEALAALRVQDLRYRDLLYAVVGRVLPPHLRHYIPTLLKTFDAIDHNVYGLPATPRSDTFPVRTVPDNGRLRPQVRRLVVRQSGGDEVSLQNIATDLQRLLREQVYLAPSAA